MEQNINAVAGIMPSTLGEISKVSPLAGALNEHGAQLDKLQGLVSNLASRLEAVRLPLPPTDKVENAQATPAVSVVTQRVHTHTSIVKDIQAIVSHLLQELEV